LLTGQDINWELKCFLIPAVVLLILIFSSCKTAAAQAEEVAAENGITEEKVANISPLYDSCGFILEDQDAYSTVLLWLGDDEKNRQSKGYLCFDISGLYDLRNIDILDAALRIPDDAYIQMRGDPLQFSTKLIVSAANYGDSLDREDFGIMAEGFKSEIGLQQYFEEIYVDGLKECLNDALAGGENKLQLILELDTATNKDGVPDGYTVHIENACLEVTYTADNKLDTAGKGIEDTEFLDGRTESIIKLPELAEFEKYKAVGGHLREAVIAVNDAENLRKDGINTVAIYLQVFFNEEKNDEIMMYDDIETVKKLINTLHREGFRTMIIVDATYPYFNHMLDESDHDTEDLLEKVTPLVMQCAQMSEEYGVEMFAPMYEVQLLEGGPGRSGFSDEEKVDDISCWAQEMLLKIKEVYSGKLAFHVQSFPEGIPLYNLEGYDYILFDGCPCFKAFEENSDWMEEHFSSYMDDRIDAYPGKEYIIFTEFFTGPEVDFFEPMAPANLIWESPGSLEDDFYAMTSPETQAMCYDSLFWNTWNDVSGYCIEVFKGFEYRGKPAENVIREWFAGNS
jgi:hypothetical protein